jgi:hypothetical protein
MKTKASIVVMSHLSDAQKLIDQQPNTIWANDHINFAKYVIIQCKGDLTQEINADKFWTKYVGSKFFKRD